MTSPTDVLTSWVSKLNGNQWIHVSSLSAIREEVVRKTAPWDIINVS